MAARTYAGLASEPAIAYLRSLGVSAVELLPVHQIADEEFLHGRGLTNYWGYSTIGFLAPHSGYAATGTQGDQIREFKKLLDGEGIGLSAIGSPVGARRCRTSSSTRRCRARSARS